MPGSMAPEFPDLTLTIFAGAWRMPRRYAAVRRQKLNFKITWRRVLYSWGKNLNLSLYIFLKI